MTEEQFPKIPSVNLIANINFKGNYAKIFNNLQRRVTEIAKVTSKLTIVLNKMKTNIKIKKDSSLMVKCSYVMLAYTLTDSMMAALKEYLQLTQ